MHRHQQKRSRHRHSKLAQRCWVEVQAGTLMEDEEEKEDLLHGSMKPVKGRGRRVSGSEDSLASHPCAAHREDLQCHPHSWRVPEA
ncbi:hypothetical protein WJX74_001024 [Apatococcus lobatus]|uniref:Uncharacterized protein n=1 Tax=Apatococcus lobatus TaxID=904363 RepID=A0AAW1QUD7_9CHLO